MTDFVCIPCGDVFDDTEPEEQLNCDNIRHYGSCLRCNVCLCEMCETVWFSEDMTEEEIEKEVESIYENGRCIGCVEEWGTEGYPD